MPTRSFSTAQRRRRLAVRHHLAAGSEAADVVAAAGRLVGLHGTDPAAMYLQAWARVPGVTPEAISAAMYDEVTLVRHMGMRRTMFLLPTGLVPMVQAACGDTIASTTRRKLAAELEAAGVTTDGSAWLDAAAAEIVAAAAGSADGLTGAALSKAVPAMSTRLGSPGGADAPVATRVFTLVAMEGGLVRGRPTGSWTSSQHRWQAAPPLARRDPLEATTELAERWLRAYGPAPLTDLVWWSGIGVTKLRPALARLDLVEVDLDGSTGLVLADDLDAPEDAAGDVPWTALLPSLDATAMGWAARDWYLGAHAGRLFDRSGNIAPTVWCDGRVVGAWAQRATGEVVVELFEDVGADHREAIATRARALETWLGPVRVVPRFPTPVDKALRA